MQGLVAQGNRSGQVRRRATLHRTRRVALFGVVAGAISLFIATGLTFTATNDSLTLTGITAAAAPGVYSGTTLPTGTVNSIAAPSGATSWVSGATKVAPSWTPTLNTVVGNTSATGDIAQVDTRALTGTVAITISFGNAGGLNEAYSYLILPVQIRSYSGTAWSAVLNDSAGTTTAQYLSLTNGYITYFMPAGALYEVLAPAGGSIYTIRTSGFPSSAGTLSPTFAVTVRSS